MSIAIFHSGNTVIFTIINYLWCREHGLIMIMWRLMRNMNILHEMRYNTETPSFVSRKSCIGSVNSTLTRKFMGKKSVIKLLFWKSFRKGNGNGKSQGYSKMHTHTFEWMVKNWEYMRENLVMIQTSHHLCEYTCIL